MIDTCLPRAMCDLTTVRSRKARVSDSVEVENPVPTEVTGSIEEDRPGDLNICSPSELMPTLMDDPIVTPDTAAGILDELY
jgi:hypothetical protein